jgi:hypothetical protein
MPPMEEEFVRNGKAKPCTVLLMFEGATHHG